MQEAVTSGARVVTGGRRQGALYAPTILADVKPEMRVSSDELFGPAVAVTPFTDIEEAIALANDSAATAWPPASSPRTSSGRSKFAREVQSGNLHVNWGPAVAGRPHAVRRAEGVGLRQGRPHLRRSRR